MGVARHHLAGALCFPPRESKSMLNTFVILIFIITGIGVILYVKYFSPKARIQRLWKEVFKLTYELAEIRKKADGMTLYHFNVSYGKAIRKRYSLINGILDYYFDPEEDESYIKEHRPNEELD